MAHHIEACEKDFTKAFSFVPRETDILLLCEKAKVAHTHITDKNRSKLLSKLVDKPAKLNLCPDTLNPDDTVLSILGRESKIKNDTYALIDNRTITLAGGIGNGSFGPNCVMYNCNGVINLFDCDPNELQCKLQDFFEFRDTNALNVLNVYNDKLIKHRECGYKVSLSEDKVIPADIQSHYDNYMELFSMLVGMCKHNNIHEYGLGIASYCQTWMRKNTKPGNAEFSVMSPHYQTRIFIKDAHLLRFMLESNYTNCDVDAMFDSYVFLHNYCIQSMPEYGMEGGGQAFVNMDGLFEKENVLYIGGGGGGDTAIAAVYSLTHKPNETPFIMGAGNSRKHIMKYITKADIDSDENIYKSVNNPKRGVSRQGFSTEDAQTYMEGRINAVYSTDMVMQLKKPNPNTKLDMSLLGNTQYGSLEEESVLSANFGTIYMLSVVGGHAPKYFDSNGLPMNKAKMVTEIGKTTQALCHFVQGYNIQKIVYIDVGLDVTQQRDNFEDLRRDEIVLHSCLSTNIPLQIVGLGAGADGHAIPTDAAQRVELFGFTPFSNQHFLNVLHSRYNQLCEISTTLMKPGRANRIFLDASCIRHKSQTPEFAFSTLPKEISMVADSESLIEYFQAQLYKRTENPTSKITHKDVLLMGTMFEIAIETVQDRVQLFKLFATV